MSIDLKDGDNILQVNNVDSMFAKRLSKVNVAPSSINIKMNSPIKLSMG